MNPTGVRQYDAVQVNDAKRPKLFNGREPIHLRRVSDAFRQLKWWIMAITPTIYYVTPWLRWDRGPYAPDQAVMIDMPARRFYFLWIEIWPQEFFFAGLLIMSGLGLFLVTSAMGRTWCGYACPQTVWTDLFILVERLIEGDRNARIKLDQALRTMDKLAKKVAVHGIWLAIAVATGGAWIFYVADAPTLLAQFLRGEAAPVAYITGAILAFTTYTLGGLMRERFCTYRCPRPRIQAAMMDRHSLTVTYNDWRGELRSRHSKRAAREGLDVGDCVDCNACVAVCPTGIDIRNGQQLPCITCALCIDACNEVMDKVGKPRGLISYTTLEHYNERTWSAPRILGRGTRDGRADRARLARRGSPAHRALLPPVVRHRPRHGLCRRRCAIGSTSTCCTTAPPPQFVQLSSGDLRNGYTVKILNMTPRPRDFDVGLVGLEGASMWTPDLELEPARRFTVSAEPDSVRELRVFVQADPDTLASANAPFAFRIFEVGGRESAEVETRFSGPAR